MRTAGLPTFSKLYGRNDTTTLPAGKYQVQIYYSELVDGDIFNMAYNSCLRLSSTRLQGNQVTRDLHGFLDRRQEPILGMGVCGSGMRIRTSRARGHHSSPLQTSVCSSLPLNLFSSANCVVDVWETCRVSLGIGSDRCTGSPRGRNATLLYIGFRSPV